MPRRITIQIIDRPLKIPLQAQYCDTFLSRLLGLMFRHDIAINEGLLLVQKKDSKAESSIHMLAVNMDLAVFWIDSNFVVVDRVLAKSWHLAYFPSHPAKYTLETHPHRLEEFSIGDKVVFNEI